MGRAGGRAGGQAGAANIKLISLVAQEAVVSGAAAVAAVAAALGSQILYFFARLPRRRPRSFARFPTSVRFVKLLFAATSTNRINGYGGDTRWRFMATTWRPSTHDAAASLGWPRSLHADWSVLRPHSDWPRD